MSTISSTDMSCSILKILDAALAVVARDVTNKDFEIELADFDPFLENQYAA